MIAEMSDMKASFERFVAESNATTAKLHATLAEVKSENAHLKTKGLEGLEKKVDSKEGGPIHINPSPDAADEGELMMRYSSRWRGFLFAGGCTSPHFKYMGTHMTTNGGVRLQVLSSRLVQCTWPAQGLVILVIFVAGRRN